MKALILSALLLAGCAKAPQPEMVDNRICRPAEDNVSGGMTECVHDWAFRLARSAEPAGVVAKAAVSACVNVIDQDAQRTSIRVAGHPDEDRRQAFIKISTEILEGQALFRVVQARAGRCPYR